MGGRSMRSHPDRQLVRLLPAVAVTGLLCLAAAAPARKYAIAPAPSALAVTVCDEFASAVNGDSSVAIPNASGLEQVLPAGISVAACSLGIIVKNYGNTARISFRDWDPTTLAPDPDAIVHRTFFVDGSNLWWTGGRVPRFPIVPPIVSASVPGVAEPPKPQLAIQVIGNTWSADTTMLRGYFTPDGPAELPAATRLNPDGTREPLPGPHPVLAHAVCDGGADVAALRVVQAVSRADVKPFPSPQEFAQRFRVPQQVELRWIELAMAGFTFGGTYDNPGIVQFP